MDDNDLIDTLKRVKGYSNFREAQWPIVRAIAANQDCLALLATGGGKSLCYQIPALLDTKPTIVISPLIALMDDQVNSLLDTVPKEQVAALHSAIPRYEQQTIFRQLGKVKLLYMSPERFCSDDMIQILANTGVARIVVDEAHCISQWGGNFRPAYRQLAPFIASLETQQGRRVSVSAFTATAPESVCAEIQQHLQRELMLLKMHLDRPNIKFLRVDCRERRSQKPISLSQRVKALREESIEREQAHQLMTHAIMGTVSHRKAAGPILIYCATTKSVERLCRSLRLQGQNAESFHSRLSQEQKQTVLQQFLADDVEIVVATNAFGMGIDKSNIRTVIHYEAPSTIEALWQEAGRAGRDGEPAMHVMIHHPTASISSARFLVDKSHPSGDALARWSERITAYAASMDEPFSSGSHLLREATGIIGSQMELVCQLLASHGVLELNNELKAPGSFARYYQILDPNKLSTIDFTRQNALRDKALADLDRVNRYLAATRCLREVFLNHFSTGSSRSAPSKVADCCSVCDSLRGRGATRPQTNAKHAARSQIIHRLASMYGKGLHMIARRLQVPTLELVNQELQQKYFAAVLRMTETHQPARGYYKASITLTEQRQAEFEQAMMLLQHQIKKAQQALISRK
ncbi:RecQ family ATP-dependent DNA helicase [Aliagarivorans taiwanensis]|uniref:RecQ family ATP-dependent DNA helicase n=1 Tax=Aliagarivorans taiwanensis TaxID=561966 RepID=UPI00146FBABB|nr:RecQ family ATP-dependent DNA helicase [Aliagarivorans taiwanensis]